MFGRYLGVGRRIVLRRFFKRLGRYFCTISHLPLSRIYRTVGTRISNRHRDLDNDIAKIELSELNPIATLGSGAFGRVDLVSYREKRIFALKTIKKMDDAKAEQVHYSEENVMMQCGRSPFIIELYKTFRNDKYVFLLLEACMGGDVWTVMSQRGFFDEETARFISACVVEAFDFLHSQNIVYRDLKPENMMLTTDGYCKLIDFGLAQIVQPNCKTTGFGGTPEYMAPEIVLERAHDRAVDYWGLGVLIYELLAGETPFRASGQVNVFQKILAGIEVAPIHSVIPPTAQNLIEKLLKKLPAERLGYQHGVTFSIKTHSWFKPINWTMLRAKQLESPIKRPINSMTDTQYFVTSKEDNDDEPTDEISGSEDDF